MDWQKTGLIIRFLVEFFGPLVLTCWLLSTSWVTRRYARYCQAVNNGTFAVDTSELQQRQERLAKHYLDITAVRYDAWQADALGRPVPLSFLRDTAYRRHVHHQVVADMVVFTVPGHVAERRWPLATIDLDR